jgi:uncharacterized protein YqeY
VSLIEQIQKELHRAMKSKDTLKTGALRNILSKLRDRQIEKREILSESEELKVFQSLVKQRKESIAMFEQGGRLDLIEKESIELEILETYLPKMLTEKDVLILVQQVVREVGADSLSDLGKVMPAVMQRGAGKVDGKLAQKIVQEVLQ